MTMKLIELPDGRWACDPDQSIAANRDGRIIFLAPAQCLAAGLTREAAFDSRCTGAVNDGPGRTWTWEDGEVQVFRADKLGWYPLYSLHNDWVNSTGCIAPDNFDAHMRDMQKYGALLSWWNQPGWEEQK